VGRREKVTSYDNATVGSGSVVNQVQFVYDDFGQLVTEYQEHGGAVNTSTSLKVQYAYADGSSNTIRLTKMTYPDGRELNYDYGSSGSTDDALARVAALIDDDGSTHLVDYSYLGRNAFVKTDYAEPDLRYDLAMGTGDDPYDGLDRFGRVVDSRWYDYGSSADVDRIKYGYDRAGNRTYREQTCDSNSYHDEVYGYDDINRLTEFDRGVINANKDAISTLKFAQEWSLDSTGNWAGFKEDDDGDSSWDLDQSRTSNKVNEITNITETTGPAWVTPAYNRAGNMTTIPQPADPTASFAATYDAWNRLVKLVEGSDTVAEYEYDGAKRRVVKKAYDGGSLDETRHFYYTDPKKWQVVEERLESGGSISSDPDRQFVWGLRYIDDLVLRDRDTTANGTLDERLYALQDANWNVTALADTSGSVLERYAYASYGSVTIYDATFANIRNTSAYSSVVLYTGRELDSEGGLYHYRNRYYSAELGTFVSRDPIASNMTASNRYDYTSAQPLLAVDPSGETPWNIIAGACCGVCEYALLDWIKTTIQLCAGQRNRPGNPALDRCIGRVVVNYWNGLGPSGQTAVVASCGFCTIKIAKLCRGKARSKCFAVAIAVYAIVFG
jgi:RHS repeat-associated protein